MHAAAGAELENIWSLVQAELERVVGEPTYRIWLQPLRPLEMREDTLVVLTPPHAQRWIADRFGRLLHDAALASGARIELVAADPQDPAADAPARRAPVSRAPGRPPARRPSPESLGNPKLTFDQFVIGDSNRLAHAAALTVAEMPAQAYNPLFICGPPGVGKTHLLSSIANLLSAHSPGLSIRLTTGESFTNAFLGALHDGSIEGFKAHFRHVDVLLVDDVQFLERKTRTEEEFFHTFNALYDDGPQIVLPSDRPPNDLQALEDRLRERFQAGLVADVRPPDMVTRVAILRKRAQHDGISLDEQALELIAERVQSNVRTLEGALIRVVAFSSLTGRELTAALAEEVLLTLYPRTTAATRTRTIPEIQAAACAHFGLSTQELLSTTRSARVAWPRQVAMYLARELTAESLPAIGREFGGRDHTTVLHACRRASARIANDDEARLAVEKLCTQLAAADS